MNIYSDKHICHIIAAGEDSGLDFSVRTEDFVIAADGGYKYLLKEGIRADLLVGDFDSLGEPPESIETMRLPKEKDDTDTFAAVKEGVRRKYSLFYLHCACGGRPEHTFANIQILAWLAENKMNGLMFDRKNIFCVIKNAALVFTAEAEGYISVFSISEKSVGVNLRGLKYELRDKTLTNNFPLGVSNEFCAKESSVSVEDGVILIIFERKNLSKKINQTITKPSTIGGFM